MDDQLRSGAGPAGNGAADAPTEPCDASSRTGEALPSRIGEFRIVRALGRGGMGVVYEAWQESMRRSVALKVLDGGAYTSLDAVSRFEREAYLSPWIRHSFSPRAGEEIDPLLVPDRLEQRVTVPPADGNHLGTLTLEPSREVARSAELYDRYLGETIRLRVEVEIVTVPARWCDATGPNANLDSFGRVL